jgi:2-methylisocitrate lyase-like PEP mutase family enzyme
MHMGLLSQGEKANALLSFHTGGELLVLPNIWNPLGARILEKKGYKAVATASAAIAASLGYQDGETIRRSTLLDLVSRIAGSVDLPVTVDIERGYAETLSELEATAEQVLDAGIVGVNIEDSIEGGVALRTVEEQCQRISAIRQVAVRRGVHLVINARIDSYLSSSFKSSEESAYEAITRAQAYAEAGADCIYPIGPGDEATVRLLRKHIASPLNILASPKAAPLPLLREIGVNRVSFGPFLLWSCLRTFSDITDSLLTTGDYSGFNGMMSKAEVAKYLVSGRE